MNIRYLRSAYKTALKGLREHIPEPLDTQHGPLYISGPIEAIEHYVEELETLLILSKETPIDERDS